MAVPDIARSTGSASATPETTPAQRRLVLVVCSSALLIVGLDSTIVNVALPAIRDSLGASVPQLQWTVDAYTLVLACLLMLAGSTADRVGRRRIFQLGLATFSVGSLLCALAPNVELLIAARALQAVGGSMLSPVAMSIIRNVFDDPAERARAIGIYAAMFGLSIALGPVVGGALVDSVGWRAVFFVNLPVAAGAIALTARYVPESRAERPRRLDPVGQLLVIAGLASLTYAIIEGPGTGWTSAPILVLLVVAAAATATLVAYELRRDEPLLEMRFFRSAPFAGASAMAVCAFAALGGFLFLNTLYLQGVRGLSPLEAGLALLPLAATVMICAPLSGRLVGERGARPVLLAAGVALVAGLTMITHVDAHTDLPFVLVAYALFGAGFGLVNPPITNTAVSGMPPAQAGVAAAVASTSRQVGLGLGVAAVGAIAGRGSAAAVIHNAGPAWWALVGMGVAVLVLGALSTGRRAQATADRTAAVLG